MADAPAEASRSVREPRSARYQPMVIVLAAMAAGIAIDRRLPLPLAGLWLASALALLAWVALVAARRPRLAAVMLAMSLALLAGAWHHAWWHVYAGNEIGLYAQRQPQPVCMEAIARGIPWRDPAGAADPMRGIPLGDTTRLELDAVRLRSAGRWQTISGHLALTVKGHLLGVAAGDRLRIFGEMSAPPSAENPGEFDYAWHLRADRKLALLSADGPDSVTVVSRAAAPGLGTCVETLRGAGDRLLWSHIDHQRSGLAAAILLGAREGIDEDLTQAFMETGTVHILSISGLHVALVAWGMAWLARLAMLSRRAGWLVVATAVVAYTLLADAQPPAVRSAIVVLVVCGGEWLGRRPLGFNSLAAAGVAVLVLNPAELFRPGPQLSFLCVAVLMVATPRLLGVDAAREGLDRLIWESRRPLDRAARNVARGVLTATLTSAAVWLVTLPLVVARYHLVSPVALLLNMLVGPPMMLALVSGFGILATGWLLPPLAAACGWICDRSLALSQWLTEWGRALPASHGWFAGPPDWWLFGFYSLLAAALVLRKRGVRCCIAAIGVWVSLGVVLTSWPKTNNELQGVFLSVGHGTAAILHLPGGETFIYDAGKFASPERCSASLASYLWSKRIGKIDAVILSHGDLDHFNGLPGLLDRFAVGRVYVPPGMFERSGAALGELQSRLRDGRVPVVTVAEGCVLWNRDGVRLTALHPCRGDTPQADNPRSLVIEARYAAHRILLPGDLEPPGLDQLTAKAARDCDLLLAPHHGSAALDDLARWCQPETIVISGRTPEGPHDLPANDANVLHTGIGGPVWFSASAKGLRAGYEKTAWNGGERAAGSYAPTNQ